MTPGLSRPYRRVGVGSGKSTSLPPKSNSQGCRFTQHSQSHVTVHACPRIAPRLHPASIPISFIRKSSFLLPTFSSVAGTLIIAMRAAATAQKDDFMALGRSICEALRTVSEAAEAARARIRQTRAALCAAVNTRCDELEVAVDDAEAAKNARLERHLYAVDSALETHLTEERFKEIGASVTQGDAVHNGALPAGLSDAGVRLPVLPTAVMEPTHMGLVTDEPALLAAIACFGRVVAPLPVTAADLSLHGAPHSRVYAGDDLCLRLSLDDRIASQSEVELQISLGQATKMTRVVAFLEVPGIGPHPLPGAVTADAANRCLIISVPVPSYSDIVAATASFCTCAVAVTVAEQLFPGSL